MDNFNTNRAVREKTIKELTNEFVTETNDILDKNIGFNVTTRELVQLDKSLVVIKKLICQQEELNNIIDCLNDNKIILTDKLNKYRKVVETLLED